MMPSYEHSACHTETGLTAISVAAGFPPVIGRNARVLILGSMPGQLSLDRRQYYAQPRNAFWLLMGEMFGAGPQLAYRQRLSILKTTGVALWDVLAACERAGSLDSRIVTASARANDLAAFLHRHPTITHIFFNGGKAAQLFARFRCLNEWPLAGGLAFATLPSTSPAHTLALPAKRRAWAAVSHAVAS